MFLDMFSGLNHYWLIGGAVALVLVVAMAWWWMSSASYENYNVKDQTVLYQTNPKEMVFGLKDVSQRECADKCTKNPQCAGVNWTSQGNRCEAMKSWEREEAIAAGAPMKNVAMIKK